MEEIIQAKPTQQPKQQEKAAPPESATPAPAESVAPPPTDSVGSGPKPVEDRDDPMHPDNLIEDFRNRIRQSLTQKEVIGQLQQARELGCFMKSHMDGLQITANERLAEVSGKKK
jgi:hypothetical protein